ncbi:MAG TPA: cellulose biosynthesis cyclic di-GMP-binding regulatory protein BcsB, partial [Nocardioides sp.]|nr:cellulose biosynthesis cyclic di-GMP-binding regulatory protein BcsB [Nocardioides sp.]
ALAHRYDDDTPVNLSLSVPPAEQATAGQRVVALVPGPPGDVTTAVSTTSGIPMLTLTGAGKALVDAARALSTDLLGLSGSEAQDLSQQTKPRSEARTRTLKDLGTDGLALSGYGSVAQQFELRQDSFGVPVSSMDLHLEGSHTAFPDASGARLDVRANGDLVGSATLGDEATFDLDVHIPSGRLRSVNDIALALTAVAPDGSACTPPSIPAAEVDVDTVGSTVTVTHGTGQARGFQLFPQVFEGTVPVALRSNAGRQAAAAVNAAALIAALQRAAGSQLDIQLMQPDAFLADDRPGLMVGAVSADSEALDAPLQLSSTRLIDRDDATVDITSQDPYAALESIDRNDRLVLMLGSWAPGNTAAPVELTRKVVDAVVNTGWSELDGDLVIADDANPAFVAASRSLAPHQPVKEERSWAKWFVLAIAVLLLVLALQVVIAIRRDRRLSRDRQDDYEDDEPAYIEDEDDSEYGVDALGDVDDLQVHDYAAPVPVAVAVHQADDDTGELPAVGGEVEYYEEEGDWGDESDDATPEQEEEPAEPEEPEPEPEPEPEDEPEPPPPPAKKTTKRPRKR